jgi:hypothetical protein
VEEFGSVYEGLLEFAPAIVQQSTGPVFTFVHGDERSSSGSHYTPEELVKPLITHSLDYLIADKLKEADPEKGLLSLTICDVACGSGHILLSAARRVGFELAKVRSKEDQPTPTVLRAAVRDVIRHCIYGVDLNPLAVELCKVALWLEAHDPGQPLNFLDHRIKCGNAIVGLAHANELERGIASEAFKTLPGDEKEVASAFKKRNDQEVKAGAQLSTFEVEQVDHELKDVQGEFNQFAQLPESTPEEIARKEKVYRELTNGKKWWRLKQLADLQVAQFFIPKTLANKEKLTTHSQYMTNLKQGTQILDRGASLSISAEKRFFHWFLEFPEVFQRGGFDCILGNPPFLGGLRISNNYGYPFLNYIQNNNLNCKGTCDLVAYFFRRDFSILNKKGFLSLISTNTISQGDTRLGSLEIITKDGDINFAVKSTKWPGLAAVEIALVTVYKGKWHDVKFLNNKPASVISPFLDETSDEEGLPFVLKINEGKSYIGSFVLGDGFIIENELRENLIERNQANSRVIFPFINGDDLNNNISQKPNRYIINLSEFELDYCKVNFTETLRIVEEKVMPERLLNTYSKSAREKWWKYERPRLELYRSISNLDRCLVTALTGKNLAFAFVKPGPVFSHATAVIATNGSFHLSMVQATIHEIWAWKYCSSMGISLRYTPSDGFQTFPFPQNLNSQQDQELATIGESYHEHRRQLMLGMQLGLTKTYNLFHSNAITAQVINERDRQIAALIKHLEKTPNTVALNEAIQGILKLRELHVQMDEAVLEAYGWAHDDTKWGKAIQLRHDFYEVDYLPENDRVRYTIHPEARKEVLKRLLQLNHERYAEEVAAGLHDKKKTAGKKGRKEKDGEVEEQGELF